MNRQQRQAALALARKILPPDEFERAVSIEVNDAGFGYDPFGLEKETAVLALAVLRYVYKYWFRVESHGVEHVPSKGRALIVPNHSGVVPIDGVMIAVDLANRMKKPRIARAMVDNFAGFLPYVNVFFNRVGSVIGARRNFSDLLEQDELVVVFPEGTKGVGKPFSRRYNLVRFNVGFIELALRHRAPIIPTAVIGAEEQAPLLFNIKPIARMLGFPYFPVTPFFPHLGPLGAIPLPVKYHIFYGPPIELFHEYGPETLEDLEKVRMLADRVQMVVQDMIIKGLDQRKTVFGFGE